MFARLLGQCNFPVRVNLVAVFRPTAETEATVHKSLKRDDQPALWLQNGIR